MIFGSGTRLNIEPKQTFNPSYYKLETDSVSACLATGFTKHDATASNDIFSETVPSRISGDSLFNQVALLKPADQEKCEKEDADSGSCDETLEKDPMVNLMSMTVLGLRLLFLKTIVFNVLMTFRLWISQ
ncbi:M1-specific T cell receptor alpha chain [Pempheris klunzingeri]|uniref:M1-specific T cell receptor alpha chain n=1 Tax=Pempheris klunzingeri TaxID=3127111 RepID=UPI0039806D02